MKTLLTTALALAALSCDGGTQFHLRDTEGSSYRVSCTGAQCKLEIASPMGARPGLTCTAGEHAGFALLGRRVLVACHACVSDAAARPDLARCRPIRCDNVHDCVHGYRGVAVSCVAGLCQAPSQGALDDVAAAGLCMAGSGVSSAAVVPLAEDRLAFARSACANGTCTAPSGCRSITR